MSLSNETAATATIIELVKTQEFESWRAELTPSALQWVSATQFEAKSGQHTWLPDASGEPAKVVVGWDGADNLAGPISRPARPVTRAVCSILTSSPIPHFPPW